MTRKLHFRAPTYLHHQPNPISPQTLLKCYVFNPICQTSFANYALRPNEDPIRYLTKTLESCPIEKKDEPTFASPLEFAPCFLPSFIFSYPFILLVDWEEFNLFS